MDGKYTNPGLRERIKNRIMAGSSGANPGQWSARKAQLLAQAYKKAGGGYKGGPGKAQKSLRRWTKQKWQAADGGNSRIEKGGKTVTRKYLPKSAWKSLDKKEIKSLNRSKAIAEKSGEQFSQSPEKLRGKISRHWKKG